jgi:hypothetical protein
MFEWGMKYRYTNSNLLNVEALYDNRTSSYDYDPVWNYFSGVFEFPDLEGTSSLVFSMEYSLERQRDNLADLSKGQGL